MLRAADFFVVSPGNLKPEFSCGASSCEWTPPAGRTTSSENSQACALKMLESCFDDTPYRQQKELSQRRGPFHFLDVRAYSSPPHSVTRV